MVEHLPANNAAARDLNGPWGDTEYLLRDVANQLRTIAASYYNVHRAKGAQAQEPERIPTPDEIMRDNGRSTEQVKTEQDHLLVILSRDRSRHDPKPDHTDRSHTDG